MKTLLHFTESIDPKEILPQSFLATLSPRVKWEMVAGTKYQILENRYHVSCYRGGQWKTLQSALTSREFIWCYREAIAVGQGSKAKSKLRIAYLSSPVGDF